MRIRRQKAFRVGILGTGVVTKARALKEVAAQTPIGLALVDIEHRAIRLMREYADRHPAAPGVRRRITRRKTGRAKKVKARR